MGIPDITRAFRDGATATEPDGRKATISVHAIGDLILTTGRIVACDPFCIVGYDDNEPFALAVPPAHYRVLLSMAHFRQSDDPMYRWPRVACAMLRFAEREPVRWEPAKLEPKADGTSEVWGDGYPVDAGTGCFMDVDAARALRRWLEADASNHDEMVVLFHWAHEAGREWLRITPDPKLKANVIMFDTGWGDGLYFSYVGYDDAGEVACLVTDFGVLDEATTFE